VDEPLVDGVRIVTKTSDFDRGGEIAECDTFHSRSDFRRLDQRSFEIKDNEKVPRARARDLSAQFPDNYGQCLSRARINKAKIYPKRIPRRHFVYLPCAITGITLENSHPFAGSVHGGVRVYARARVCGRKKKRKKGIHATRACAGRFVVFGAPALRREGHSGPTLPLRFYSKMLAPSVLPFDRFLY